MLSMLGNLVIVIDDEGVGEYKLSFVDDVEGFSVVAPSSRTFSAIASIECSPDGAGAGTKNFAFAAMEGLTDGTEGE